jgi:hypothetical protein
MKKKYLLYIAVMAVLTAVMMGMDYILYLIYKMIQNEFVLLPELSYWEMFFGISLFGFAVFFIVRIFRKLTNKK